MMRFKITFLCLLTAFCAAFAQVTVKLQAPQQVETGRRFNVRYVVNTQEVEDFDVGDFPGFSVQYGPAVSRSSSFQSINGHTTQSSTMTFTYTLVAEKKGKFTLPAATALVGGTSYKSNTQQIEVLEGSEPSSAPQQSQPMPQANTSVNDPFASAPSSVKPGDELFISVSASKQNVYEQEAVLLTYKIYTLVDVQQITGEMPQLDDFHVEELPSSQNMTLQYEKLNGRNYGSAIWRQYLVFPQKSGRLTIPSITFEAQVVSVNRNIDPIDAYFNGMNLTSVSRRELKTKALTLDVKELPTPKPASFSGAVGSFTISSTLSPQELDANDAATLRLIVTGQGNMKLMKDVMPNFPADFEVYPPKIDEKTSLTSAGNKGEVTYEYVVVPRHAGNFAINPIEFCYFDPSAQAYKTLMTEPYNLTVNKGRGVEKSASNEHEDLQVIANDIHHIHRIDSLQAPDKGGFFGSTSYWLIYVIAFGLCVLVIVVFNRQARANANTTRRRSKGAGKVASRRLKNAAKYLHTSETDLFYDELMKALLGYAGDKLNLPTTELNKDSLREQMQQAGVNDELVQRYLDVLSEAEFARFAPGDPGALKERLFANATEAINKLDEAIK